jgi:hypothetical protein
VLVTGKIGVVTEQQEIETYYQASEHGRLRGAEPKAQIWTRLGSRSLSRGMTSSLTRCGADEIAMRFRRGHRAGRRRHRRVPFPAPCAGAGDERRGDERGVLRLSVLVPQAIQTTSEALQDDIPERLI